MIKPSHIDLYNIILLRYSGEIWLKSPKVRYRMIKTLIKNIKIILNKEGLSFSKYQLSKDSTRILFFFDNKDIPKSIMIFKRIFGIYSISPTLRTLSNLKNISEKTIFLSEKILEYGDTFALRVKRAGKHDFKSHDIGREVGKNIIEYFKDLNLTVDLTNPKKKIFIEVRDEFSYIFTEIIESEWEGLPIEYNKKIITMDIGRVEDLLGGFLLMRRGCELYPILFNLNKNKDCFEQWLQNWKEVFLYVPFFKFTLKTVNLQNLMDNIERNLEEKQYLCGLCRLVRFQIISNLIKDFNIDIKAFSDGLNFNNISLCNDNVDLNSNALTNTFLKIPIFSPLIGLNSDEIESYLNKISNKIKSIDYCKYNPQNQEFDSKKLINLYNKLRIKNLIDNEINLIKDISICNKN
ncbi:MAG: hypothetical protein JXA99_07570 [Candidatus Lokiarchaeota archaeon]|nr:hypothetical protein [Candidatus Lokiarchaeota archaeon]